MDKKWILTLIVLGTLFLSATFVYSAPAPWGIALNHETKKCSGYWAGDEFKSFELPTGWKDYYPEYRETGDAIIKTEIGECNFSRGNEEDCCNQLDFTYVAQNIGKGITTTWGMQSNMGSFFGTIFLPFLIILIIGFIVLKIKKKSFIPFLKTYPKKGLFLGGVFGFLSSLAFYGVNHFSGIAYRNIITNFFSFFSQVTMNIIYYFTSIFVPSCIANHNCSYYYEKILIWPIDWVVILILNVIIYAIIGLVIGLMIQNLKGRKK